MATEPSLVYAAPAGRLGTVQAVAARLRASVTVAHLVDVLGLSAGVHGALALIHAADDPGLAALYALASLLAAALAVALVRRPGRDRFLVAAVLLGGLVAAYVAALVLHLPGTDETPVSIDEVGIATKLIELAGIGWALGLARGASSSPRRATLDRAIVMTVLAAVFILLIGHEHGY